MKTRTLTALLFVLFALAGCSTISVVSDYDSTIPVAAYKTYHWNGSDAVKNGTDILPENPLILKRIRSSVDKELAARGYLLSVSGPVDFTVAVYAGLREKLYYDLPPSGFYYYRGFRGRYGFYDPFWWGGPYVRSYQEGSLGIDIYDQRTGKLAWRGVGRGIVNDHRNGDELQKDIDEAVTKILAEFPPLKQ
jgi:hypothetical protein